MAFTDWRVGESGASRHLRHFAWVALFLVDLGAGFSLDQPHQLQFGPHVEALKGETSKIKMAIEPLLVHCPAFSYVHTANITLRREPDRTRETKFLANYTWCCISSSVQHRPIRARPTWCASSLPSSNGSASATPLRETWLIVGGPDLSPHPSPRPYRSQSGAIPDNPPCWHPSSLFSLHEEASCGRSWCRSFSRTILLHAFYFCSHALDRLGSVVSSLSFGRLLNLNGIMFCFRICGFSRKRPTERPVAQPLGRSPSKPTFLELDDTKSMPEHYVREVDSKQTFLHLGKEDELSSSSRDESQHESQDVDVHPAWRYSSTAHGGDRRHYHHQDESPEVLTTSEARARTTPSPASYVRAPPMVYGSEKVAPVNPSPPSDTRHRIEVRRLSQRARPLPTPPHSTLESCPGPVIMFRCVSNAQCRLNPC